MRHTCIDKLIDVQDSQGWALAMASRKSCPVCILKKLAADFPKMKVIFSEPKIKKGKIRYAKAN